MRKRKLQCFGHVVRQSGESLAKTVLEFMVGGKRSRSRLEESSLINITKWTGMKVPERLEDICKTHFWNCAKHF